MPAVWNAWVGNLGTSIKIDKVGLKISNLEMQNFKSLGSRT